MGCRKCSHDSCMHRAAKGRTAKPEPWKCLALRHMEAGRKISRLREDAGLTTGELAEAAGLGADYMARVEGGKKPGGGERHWQGSPPPWTRTRNAWRCCMKDNKDCAMWLGYSGRHCSGWKHETCEGCRHAKLKSDGYYKSNMDKTMGHILRRDG